MGNRIYNLCTILTLYVGVMSHNWMFYAGALLSILAAFALRIGIEWSNNTLSWKNVGIQAIMTVSLCFLAFIVWRDYKINLSIEFYLFFSSFFAVFIVNVIDKIFKVGFKAYARLLLRRILAKDELDKID